MGRSAVTAASGSGMTIEEDLMSLQTKSEGNWGLDEGRYRLRCSTGKVLRSGDIITIDGATGVVYLGVMPMVPAGRDEEYQTILKWADKYKRMLVLANAETPKDVVEAFSMGAEGMGLCHTELMFFFDCIDLMCVYINIHIYINICILVYIYTYIHLLKVLDYVALSICSSPLIVSTLYAL
jgi:phosphoenolpyruvate synthase/pyruvate phosphate dikinase